MALLNLILFWSPQLSSPSDYVVAYRNTPYDSYSDPTDNENSDAEQKDHPYSIAKWIYFPVPQYQPDKDHVNEIDSEGAFVNT